MAERSAAQEFAYLARLPPKEASDYLKGRGQLTPTFSWQDLWHEEHAQQFTVSRLARMDILKAMQDGITASVNGDLSRRDWIKSTKALLQKEGWWGEKEVLDPVTGETVITKFDPARLALIYDTNTRMAHSAGLWQRVERNKKTHPYVRYVTKGDERVRASHRKWHNLVLPVDHPLWQTIWPPNGWRCRCWATSLSQSEYDKGYSEYRPPYEYNPDGSVKRIPPVVRAPFNKTAPDLVMREWVNKRTGEVSRVPVGIDPGFDYNPGRARDSAMLKVGQEKLAAAAPQVRQAAIVPGVGDGVSRAYGAAVTAAYESLPVAARETLAAGGFEVQVVRRIVDAVPELARRSVPGAPGLAYTSAGGLTIYDNRLILIAEQTLVDGAWKPVSAAIGEGLLIHEVGHGLSYLLKWADSPTVRAAWQKEATALAGYRSKVDSDLEGDIMYFTQAWPRGLVETVAELYALRHTQGTVTYLDVAAAFPETRAALEALLDGKDL